MVVASQKSKSELMAAVRQKHTSPEIKVRKALHRVGLRFRLHKRDLPGTPDIVLPRLKLAIFVHGCFWHQHTNCKKATIPKNNPSFWKEKFSDNKRRDALVQQELIVLGWNVEIIWECETKSAGLLEGRIQAILKRYTTKQVFSNA